MEKINDILSRHNLKPRIKAKRKTNPEWEECKEFLRYLDIETSSKNIIRLRKLCKDYGSNKVLGLKSYLKDSNMNRQKWSGYIATIIRNRK